MFTPACEVAPSQVHAWTNRSATLIRLRRLEEALNAADRAIQIDSRDVWGWNNKGIALNLMRREQRQREA